MEYREFDLSCKYDARANFYGKARVRVYENGDEDLISYNTVVAEKRGDEIELKGWYSQTTGRHINEYIQQYGFNPMTKKQIENSNKLKIPKWE